MTAEIIPTVGATQLVAFDHQPTIRTKFGIGALEQLGQSALELSGSRILLVTDDGLIKAGHVARAEDILRDSGLTVFTFSDVEENPTTACVERGVAYVVAQGGVDLIVALGGGSSMDSAKAINFLITNGGKMEDYWGKEKAKKPLLPSIGVPTTAGTGSEAQRFALISQAESHRKMACGDIKARFKTVILDPALITSVPKAVAAHAGMDAITHAVESYVSSARNPYSQLYAREAWRQLEANFERVLAEPDDLDAWGHMLLGAHYSGCAIENSMLGAAHACANPLTARYGVIHGVAVGMMLPHVIRFNADAVGPLYGELTDAARLFGEDEACERLARRVDELREAAGQAGRLRDFDIPPEALHDLAEAAKNEWTGNFNPRPVDVEALEGLYRVAW